MIMSSSSSSSSSSPYSCKSNNNDVTTTTNRTTLPIVLDNPYWGGTEATQQDLHYLLHLMHTGYFLVPQNSSDSNYKQQLCASNTSTSTSTTSTHNNDNNNYNNMMMMMSSCSHDKTKNNEDNIMIYNSTCNNMIIENLIQNNVILYNDHDFIVLNKPADLRMDGNQLATVHKLLTFLFPPPSLIHQHQRIITTSNDVHGIQHIHHIHDNQQTQVLLINAILKLSNHGDLKDNIIRSTHQLDYATSGVLLLAKSKEAASIACKAFEERTTKKQYVALLWGHVNIHNEDHIDNIHNDDNEDHIYNIDNVNSTSTHLHFPFLNHDQTLIFHRWKDLEKKSKKDRLNSKGGRKKLFTFVGYMPTHSIFAKWKALRLKQRKRQKLDPQQDHEMVIQHDNDNIWDSSPTFASIEEEQLLLSKSWKEVKSNSDGSIRLFFEDLAKQYNDRERMKNENKIKDEKSKQDEGQQQQQQEQQQNDDYKFGMCDGNLPPFFCLPGEEKDSFYVNVPLAECKNEFRVVADPKSLKNDVKCCHQYQDQYIGKDQPDKKLEFKPALTKCVIEQKGIWQGKQVTKVKLFPHTGRRHQLRVHMGLIGHAILGDATYEPKKEHVDEEKNEIRRERQLCDRMCLHAHKLTLPLNNGEYKSFCAPDPFVYSESQAQFIM